ncbi:hypothetical protein ASPBRDRAFT_135403 [Aspergillus brasiliensis CBS 101740]|uniref:F-box domain-containing protein n=1 Tax=Aspergillus brasiliensis (strain CBS 101740 / IMI 381727 / IBT 21946) TaxID=767769 RepID=A0A1L9U7J8_ASPBC|nr:hypothetical protein ASPBRDRAFT_135403 [Aspergillus brasiliensis CBS 101740]
MYQFSPPVKVLGIISQRAKAVLRALSESIFRQRRLKAPLQKMPPELVVMVLECLSTIDQICFGLSCKNIFACLEEYLKAQETKLHQLYPPEERVMLCPNAKGRPRIQLLIRLQNERWKYCHDCWTLHPHTLWQTLHDIWRPRKSCCFDCYILQGTFNCIPDAGKVDICPCISITFRDKLHLIRLCRDAQKYLLRPGTKCWDDDVLLHPSSRKLYGKLRHDCKFTGHPSIGVQIKTEFWLNEDGTRLWVINQYVFENSPSTSLSTIPTCSYKDTGNWVRRVFRDGGSRFTGWDKNRSTCYMKYHGWERLRYGEETYTSRITTLRDLGNINWPNGAWERHCDR